jgi:hypothetical protein
LFTTRPNQPLLADLGLSLCQRPPARRRGSRTGPGSCRGAPTTCRGARAAARGRRAEVPAAGRLQELQHSRRHRRRQSLAQGADRSGGDLQPVAGRQRGSGQRPEGASSVRSCSASSTSPRATSSRDRRSRSIVSGSDSTSSVSSSAARSAGLMSTAAGTPLRVSHLHVLYRRLHEPQARGGWSLRIATSRVLPCGDATARPA